MNPVIYAHPFSSYCQKVLLALAIKGIDFDYRLLEMGDADATAELAALWPMKRFPVLKHGERVVAESSIIIEYLDQHWPETQRLIPEDPDAALEVRFLDRYFDQYVMTPMSAIVFDHIRAPEDRSARTVADAGALLDTAYVWLEGQLANRTHAAGEHLTMADCAAAPALFYADWVRPIPEGCRGLRAYRARLNAQPMFAALIDAARPYRPYFPPGAPDRD